MTYEKCKFYLLSYRMGLKLFLYVLCCYKRRNFIRGTIFTCLKLWIYVVVTYIFHFHIISPYHGNKMFQIVMFCYQNKSPQCQSFELHQFSAFSLIWVQFFHFLNEEQQIISFLQWMLAFMLCVRIIIGIKCCWQFLHKH